MHPRYPGKVCAACKLGAQDRGDGHPSQLGAEIRPGINPLTVRDLPLYIKMHSLGEFPQILSLFMLFQVLHARIFQGRGDSRAIAHANRDVVCQHVLYS